MRTAGDRTGEVALDTLDHRRAVEIGDEPIDVEPKLCGVADQILALQRVLTGEHEVQPRPEHPLVRRCLGRTRGNRPVRVVRKMAHHIPQVVTEVGAKIVPRTGGVRTVLALEVHVLDECELRVLRPADVIDLRIDRRLKHHRQVRGLLTPPLGGDLEDEPPEQRGEHHRHEHADRRLAAQVRGRAEREPDDQQRHGKADPGQRRPTEHAPHPDALGQPAQAETDGDERGEPDAQELAEHEPCDDAPRDWRAKGLGEQPATQVHPGVRQGEHRHDQQRRRQPQELVQPLVHRDTPGQPAVHCAGRCGTRRLPEVAEQLFCRDDLVTLRRVGGDQQPRGHPGERGMDAGVHGCEPQHDHDQHIRHCPPLAGAP